MNLADEISHAESNDGDTSGYRSRSILNTLIDECSEMIASDKETSYNDTANLSLGLRQMDDSWMKADEMLVDLILLMQRTSRKLASATLLIQDIFYTSHEIDETSVSFADNELITQETLDEIDCIPNCLREIRRQHYKIDQQLPVVADSIQGFNQKSFITVRQASRTCQSLQACSTLTDIQ